MNTRHTKKYHLGLICAVCTALVAALLLAGARWEFDFLDRLEVQFRDFLVRHGHSNPPDPQLVFLGISSDSMSIQDLDFKLWTDIPSDSPDYRALKLMHQQWPWPREIHALLLDKLCAAGARLVVFDLLFPNPAPDDAVFRAALDRHRDHVLIGSNFISESLPDGLQQWEYDLPVESLIAPTEPLDARIGYVNYWEDADFKVRSARFRTTLARVSRRRSEPGDEVFLSLPARAVTQMGRGDLVPAELNKDWLFRYTGLPGKGFRPIPVYQAFVPSYWERIFQNGAAFRDKVVVVGSVGSFLHDEVDTPVGAMAGAEIHLNAINAMLHRAFLSETTFLEDLLLILVAGATAWLIFALISRPIPQVCCGLAGNALGLLLAFTAYDRWNTYVAMVAPLLAFNVSGGSALVYELVVERLEKLRTRRFFERYVSKDVVRELLDNRESVLHVLGGTRRQVTALFSDLRGFTSLTEVCDPAELVAQLNQYFREMVRVVFAHGGTLDKFMGDGLMAHWGSIVTEGEQKDAGNAVRAALEMRTVMIELNLDWIKRGLSPLNFGIGINTGEVIVGNMGSDEKMEVSLVGDAVNLASRLEGATKQCHVDLILGETTAELVREDFVLRSVDRLRVKGKTRAVDVFTVLSEHQPDTVEPEWLPLYEEAVRAFRSREFAQAIASCDRAAQLISGDPLIEEYRRRAEALLHQVPAAHWSGIQILGEK